MSSANPMSTPPSRPAAPIQDPDRSAGQGRAQYNGHVTVDDPQRTRAFPVEATTSDLGMGDGESQAPRPDRALKVINLDSKQVEFGNPAVLLSPDMEHSGRVDAESGNVEFEPRANMEETTLTRTSSLLRQVQQLQDSDENHDHVDQAVQRDETTPDPASSEVEQCHQVEVVVEEDKGSEEEENVVTYHVMGNPSTFVKVEGDKESPGRPHSDDGDMKDFDGHTITLVEDVNNVGTFKIAEIGDDNTVRVIDNDRIVVFQDSAAVTHVTCKMERMQDEDSNPPDVQDAEPEVYAARAPDPAAEEQQQQQLPAHGSTHARMLHSHAEAPAAGLEGRMAHEGASTRGQPMRNWHVPVSGGRRLTQSDYHTGHFAGVPQSGANLPPHRADPEHGSDAAAAAVDRSPPPSVHPHTPYGETGSPTYPPGYGPSHVLHWAGHPGSQMDPAGTYSQGHKESKMAVGSGGAPLGYGPPLDPAAYGQGHNDGKAALGSGVTPLSYGHPPFLPYPPVAYSGGPPHAQTYAGYTGEAGRAWRAGLLSAAAPAQLPETGPGGAEHTHHARVGRPPAGNYRPQGSSQHLVHPPQQPVGYPAPPQPLVRPYPGYPPWGDAPPSQGYFRYMGPASNSMGRGRPSTRSMTKMKHAAPTMVPVTLPPHPGQYSHMAGRPVPVPSLAGPFQGPLAKAVGRKRSAQQSEDPALHDKSVAVGSAPPGAYPMSDKTMEPALKRPRQPEMVHSSHTQRPSAPQAVAVSSSNVHTLKPGHIIAWYIDYLIHENEDRTQISRAFTLPVNLFHTNDFYFLDSLRKRVRFPSAKFLAWMQCHLPSLNAHAIDFREGRPAEREGARSAVPGQVINGPNGQDWSWQNKSKRDIIHDVFFFFQHRKASKSDSHQFVAVEQRPSQVQLVA